MNKKSTLSKLNFHLPFPEPTNCPQQLSNESTAQNAAIKCLKNAWASSQKGKPQSTLMLHEPPVAKYTQKYVWNSMKCTHQHRHNFMNNLVGFRLKYSRIYGMWIAIYYTEKTVASTYIRRWVGKWVIIDGYYMTGAGIEKFIKRFWIV